MKETIWENKYDKNKVFVVDKVKIMSAIEGKWFEGIAYKDVDRNEIYVRNVDDFLKKFEKLGENNGIE